MKTCCFTGHIALSLDEIGSILKRLDYEIDNLISQGVTEFICGDMPGFDSIVASLIVIKKELGNIVLGLYSRYRILNKITR